MSEDNKVERAHPFEVISIVVYPTARPDERRSVIVSCGLPGCTICDESSDEYLDRKGW